MTPTCTRCGRPDGTAMLFVKNEPHCPRCWVHYRRRNAWLTVAFYAGIGAWVVANGGVAVAAGFGLAQVGPAYLLVGAWVTAVVVVLLRGRVASVLVGRGSLLAAWGNAPRVVVRARPGYAGFRYLVGRPVSAARHNRYRTLARLVLLVPLLLLWGTRVAFVTGAAAACTAAVVQGLVQRRPVDGYDAYAVAAMAAAERVRRLLVAGDLPAALAASADAVAASPDDPDPWIVRADALADAGDLAASADAASHWRVASRPGEGATLAATYAWAVATGDLPDTAGAWLAVRWALHGEPAVALPAFAAVLARAGFADDARLLARYATRAVVTDERWDARARALL